MLLGFVDEAIKLLQIKEVSVVGVVLAALFLLALALERGKLVLGSVHQAAVVTHTKNDEVCKAALTNAQTELAASKEQNTELRIMITRLTTLEEFGWPEKPSRRKGQS